MNLILLFANEITDSGTATICDRRFEHIKNVHQATTGRQLKVGLINGDIGYGEVIAIDDVSVTLAVEFNQAPPPPLPLTLVIALPRPQMLKRIVQTCATMGVKKIIFLHSRRVEKSYWQTPQLTEENLQEQLLLGLEQGSDTMMPEIIFAKRFKPFIEDHLTQLCKSSTTILAHPTPNANPITINPQQATTLIIGPEGGFIDYEVEKMTTAGCQLLSLGSRILRVETAVTALIAKFFL